MSSFSFHQNQLFLFGRNNSLFFSISKSAHHLKYISKGSALFFCSNVPIYNFLRSESSNLANWDAVALEQPLFHLLRREACSMVQASAPSHSMKQGTVSTPSWHSCWSNNCCLWHLTANLLSSLTNGKRYWFTQDYFPIPLSTEGFGCTGFNVLSFHVMVFVFVIVHPLVPQSLAGACTLPWGGESCHSPNEGGIDDWGWVVQWVVFCIFWKRDGGQQTLRFVVVGRWHLWEVHLCLDTLTTIILLLLLNILLIILACWLLLWRCYD